MSTFFVAGATGYTGRHVVEHLCTGGDHTVIAHIRPDSSSREELTPRFESLGAVVDTTPWDVDALTRALSTHQPDAVFCLIGTTKARMKAADEEAQQDYLAIDFGLTDMLKRASETTHPHPLFVYLSAMGAQSPGMNAYMKARHKAEQAVMDSELPWVIARPGLITGEDRGEDRPLEQLGGKLASAVFSVLPDGEFNKKYRPTDGSELALALIHHAKRGLIQTTPKPRMIIEAQDLKMT